VPAEESGKKKGKRGGEEKESLCQASEKGGRTDQVGATENYFQESLKIPTISESGLYENFGHIPASKKGRPGLKILKWGKLGGLFWGTLSGTCG